MKIAVMQPYFFPYIGYFQLLNRADVFVILDDVNFIKRGWIHRNRIFNQGKECYITNPVSHASQNVRINETAFVNDPEEIKRTLKTIQLTYKNEKYFEPVYDMITRIMEYSENNVSLYLEHLLRCVCEYLKIDTTIVRASELRSYEHLKAQDGIIELVKILEGNEYTNPIGGTELYDKEKFKEEGITLNFIKTDFDRIKVEHADYSIIELMMKYSVDEIKEMLNCYQLF